MKEKKKRMGGIEEKMKTFGEVEGEKESLNSFQNDKKDIYFNCTYILCTYNLF